MVTGCLLSCRHSASFTSLTIPRDSRREQNLCDGVGLRLCRRDCSSSSQRFGGWLLFETTLPQQTFLRYIKQFFLFFLLTLDVMLPEELLGKADVPRIIIISVSITMAILLIFNISLVACFIFRKKNRKMNKGIVLKFLSVRN